VEPERLRRVSATGTGQLKLTGARRVPRRAQNGALASGLLLRVCFCTCLRSAALTRAAFGHVSVCCLPRRAVFDAEGAKFGWLVLDLRAAKLNAAPSGAPPRARDI
jgi:hypothetical protein